MTQSATKSCSNVGADNGSLSIVRMMDEGMSVAEMARKMRMSKDTICAMIRRVGVPAFLRRRPKDYWIRLDWNRTNSEIAKAEGVSKVWTATLRGILRAAGHPICASPVGPGHPVRWTRGTIASVDWNISDDRIAVLVGIKARSVGALRRRLRARGMRIPSSGRRSNRRGSR